MNYFRSFDGGSTRIQGVKTLYFTGGGTFPQFSAGDRDVSPSKLPAAREATFMSPQDHVWLMVNIWCLPTVEALMRISINGVVSPEHYHQLTGWNKRTKKLGSQIRENLCSLYSNKCLASEKFVLASGSNLSLATGLESWKVSLEPCPRE